MHEPAFETQNSVDSLSIYLNSLLKTQQSPDAAVPIGGVPQDELVDSRRKGIVDATSRFLRRLREMDY